MKRRRLRKESPLCWIIVGIMAVFCFLPMWITFVASITSESSVMRNGYSLWPQNVTLDTYRFLINNKGRILVRAFGVSLFTVVVGTAYTMTMMVCFAYAIAQKKKTFCLAQGLSFFAWFTTVFGGGVLPWYILTTQTYGLKNNLPSLFIPYGMNVFYMFVLRSNFRGVPEELIEAAKIDGASNLRTFLSICIPLARVGIITVVMFTILQYWNDFYLPLYLITTTELYTVQKLLYNMMANISALLSMGTNMVGTVHIELPSNTARMAMTMIAIIPLLVVFPFIQRYFVKGITIGAVKG